MADVFGRDGLDTDDSGSPEEPDEGRMAKFMLASTGVRRACTTVIPRVWYTHVSF
jgi:hypothetical protein